MKIQETEDEQGTTLSARVEIVFDNSEGRFPVCASSLYDISMLIASIQIDKDEVVLRRDIGFKKDEYYLDSHQVKYMTFVIVFYFHL